MRHSFLLPACLAWLLAGCATTGIKESLVTLDPAYFPDSPRSAVAMAAPANDRLRAAWRQVTAPDGGATDARALAPGSEIPPLPSYLVAEPLVRKLVVAAHEAIVDRKRTTIELTRDDLAGLTRSLNETFTAANMDRAVTARDAQTAGHGILRKYFVAYYADHDHGFVNREGATYKRQEIKNRIGNDIITAVVAIALEAMFDSVLETTIYVDKNGKFQTADGLEPSAHRYQVAKTEAIVERGQPGIDDLELKAIRYLSGLAGDQSKTLSGAAYRAFGCVELSFVIGGKFSIGDNDTLAKVFDTVFEIASKRIVEETARQGFERMTLHYPGGLRATADASPAARLLHDLE